MPKTSNEARALTGAAQAGDCGPAASADTPSHGGVCRQRPRQRPNTSLDFLLMLFFVALSGNTALITPGVTKLIMPAAVILLGLAVFAQKKPFGPHHGFFILALFGAIIAVQVVHFQIFSAVTILGLFCRFAIAYCAVVLIPDFAGTYVRVMLGLAALSFIFYFSYQAGAALGIDVAALTRQFALYTVPSGECSSILLHTFYSDPPDAYRNAGMFWEPGAFAGYVNLALVFLCLIRARFTKKDFYIRFVVLSVCLLTTESTIGYIAYAVVVCLEIMTRARRTGRPSLLPYLGMISALALFYVLAINLDFMVPKIQHSVLSATTKAPGWQLDRLGTIFFDLDYITVRPLTGWGIRGETRLELNPELTEGEANGRGNGMSNFAASFGVLALGVWLVLSYQTLLRLSSQRKMMALVGLIVLVISLNDECFLNYPLFLIFFFSAGPWRKVPRSLPN